MDFSLHFLLLNAEVYVLKNQVRIMSLAFPVCEKKKSGF